MENLLQIPEVAIQVSAIAGSWLSDELADATHLHETAQICSKMVVCGTFDLGKNVTLIVSNWENTLSIQEVLYAENVIYWYLIAFARVIWVYTVGSWMFNTFLNFVYVQ